MSNDKVSIITPLYNCEKFIGETIQSVLKQTYSNWEMIIVDDCSSDNSIKIVEKINDKRIKLVKLDRNSGAAASRNKGIEIATGRFIAFIDSDDLWKEDKLEKQIKFMTENNYSFSFSDYELISENSNRTGKIKKAPLILDYEQQLRYNHIGCLTVIYDTKSLGKIYMPLIRKRQDYALWLKILKQNINGYGLQECLAFYRIRNNSVSSNKLEMVLWNWRLYREAEKKSFIKSAYYLLNNIYQKVFCK